VEKCQTPLSEEKVDSVNFELHECSNGNYLKRCLVSVRMGILLCK